MNEARYLAKMLDCRYIGIHGVDWVLLAMGAAVLIAAVAFWFGKRSTDNSGAGQ